MANVYFGEQKREKLMLDDTQYIEYKKLNEGELIQYQDSISGKVIMDQDTRKGEIETKVGTERSILIKLAVCGYSIMFGEKEYTKYDKDEWEKTLYPVMDGDKANELYKKIKEFNGFDEAKKK